MTKIFLGTLNYLFSNNSTTGELFQLDVLLKNISLQDQDYFTYHILRYARKFWLSYNKSQQLKDNILFEIDRIIIEEIKQWFEYQIKTDYSVNIAFIKQNMTKEDQLKHINSVNTKANSVYLSTKTIILEHLVDIQRRTDILNFKQQIADEFLNEYNEILTESNIQLEMEKRQQTISTYYIHLQNLYEQCLFQEALVSVKENIILQCSQFVKNNKNNIMANIHNIRKEIQYTFRIQFADLNITNDDQKVFSLFGICLFDMNNRCIQQHNNTKYVNEKKYVLHIIQQFLDKNFFTQDIFDRLVKYPVIFQEIKAQFDSLATTINNMEKINKVNLIQNQILYHYYFSNHSSSEILIKTHIQFIDNEQQLNKFIIEIKDFKELLNSDQLIFEPSFQYILLLSIYLSISQDVTVGAKNLKVKSQLKQKIISQTNCYLLDQNTKRISHKLIQKQGMKTDLEQQNLELYKKINCIIPCNSKYQQFYKVGDILKFKHLSTNYVFFKLLIYCLLQQLPLHSYLKILQEKMILIKEQNILSVKLQFYIDQLQQLINIYISDSTELHLLKLKLMCENLYYQIYIDDIQTIQIELYTILEKNEDIDQNLLFIAVNTIQLDYEQIHSTFSENIDQGISEDNQIEYINKYRIIKVTIKTTMLLIGVINNAHNKYIIDQLKCSYQ